MVRVLCEPASLRMPLYVVVAPFKPTTRFTGRGVGELMSSRAILPVPAIAPKLAVPRPAMNVSPPLVLRVTVLLCSALVLLSCTTPELIVVPPLNVFAPPRINVPEPPTARLALPLITSLIVVVLLTVSDESPATLNVAGVVTPVPSKVRLPLPLLESVTLPFKETALPSVMAVPSSCSMPLLSRKLPVPSGPLARSPVEGELLPLRRTVPPERIVPPPYVFAPVRINVPLLAVNTEAAPPSVPSMVLVALALYVRLPDSEPLTGIDSAGVDRRQAAV